MLTVKDYCRDRQFGMPRTCPDNQLLELICEDHDADDVRKPKADDPYLCNYCTTKIPNGTSIGKTK